MKERNKFFITYNEHYFLYRMQIYHFDKDGIEVLYCAAVDFDSAIKLMDRYIRESDMSANVCGCWEVQETMITQNVNERKNND